MNMWAIRQHRAAFVCNLFRHPHRHQWYPFTSITIGTPIIGTEELFNLRCCYQQKCYCTNFGQVTCSHQWRRMFSSGDTARTNLVTYPVVYRGPLTKVIHLTKFVSLTSSVFGLSIQPYLISQASAAHPALIVTVGSFVCFFTYITPLAIHWLTKRYIIELQFEPESGTFICTTLNFFLRPKQLEFQASDVTVPAIPGPFTSFLAKGVPLFVDPQQFENADAYHHLMGYDKPLDLKLGKPEDKAS